MNQMTFSDMEYNGRKRVTQKEKFLREMNVIIPWAAWVRKILPYYPKGKRGRPPRGIEVMLRMYLLQIWFNLSDEGLEDAIYDSYAMRTFIGINFLEEQVPDATTLLKFRHLLEEHHLGEEIFNDIKERLEQAGLMMRGGTIVDATIIHSTSSTKNEEGKRDPEMHQTKKGKQWYHGMKVHSGVDCATGYVHTITGTAANVHDLQEASKLLRSDDEVVYGDSGYLGLSERPEIRTDENLFGIKFRINRRPSSLNVKTNYNGINWEKVIEHQKSAVRCKVEHPFLDREAAIRVLQDGIPWYCQKHESVPHAIWMREPAHVYTKWQSKGLLLCLPWVISALNASRMGLKGKIQGGCVGIPGFYLEIQG